MSRQRKIFIAITIFLLLYYFLEGIVLRNVLIYSWMCYLLVIFFGNLGKKITILDVILLGGVGLCLFPPIVASDLGYGNWLAVSIDEYLDFVFPAVIALAIGIYFPVKGERINITQLISALQAHLSSNPKLGPRLIFLGIFFYLMLVQGILAGPFKFIAYLGYNLMYIGLLYVLFSPKSQKLLYTTIVLGITVSHVVRGGMFGPIFWWSIFYLIILSVLYRPSLRTKLIIAISGVFLLVIIQAVKYEFRRMTWMGNQTTSNSDVMVDLINQNAQYSTLMSESILVGNILVRMNQALHISLTMNHVPRVKPFANGETVFLGMVYTLIPRIIWPSKPETGRGMYERFTGVTLLPGTAMNIGPIGEAYANFGRIGGVIHMFFYGLLFKYIFISIMKLARTRPTILLWIPLIFLQSLKVETDFTTTLNHTLKACIFAFIIFGIAQQVFDTKL